MFRAIPADSGLAYVVVTHLGPGQTSMLPEILGRAAGIPVATIQAGDAVAANHAYVLPPDAIVTIDRGRLGLHHTDPAHHERNPIDIFLTALAQDQGVRAIGIILSGAGSGLGGALQHDPSHIDMDVFYGAGTWYLEGVSPYGRPRTPERLEALGLHMKAYGYAPHFAPFTMALAKLDYGIARMAWSALNVLAAATLAAVIVAMMYAEPGRTRTDPFAAMMAAFLILGSPFAATVVWLGNTSIIVAACLAAGWWLDRQEKPIAAGVLLALALIKPQFAVLPLLWLTLERRWATLSACAITGIVLFTYHAVAFGPITSIRDWLDGIDAYQTLERPPGFQHLFGLGPVHGRLVYRWVLIKGALHTLMRVEILTFRVPARYFAGVTEWETYYG